MKNKSRGRDSRYLAENFLLLHSAALKKERIATYSWKYHMVMSFKMHKISTSHIYTHFENAVM